jgi:phosphopantetheinyl transferase
MQRKEKAMAEITAWLVLRKNRRPSARMTRKADECRATADGIELIGEVNHAGAPSDARIDVTPPGRAICRCREGAPAGS